MSLPIPLSVQLDTDRISRRVTAQVRDLRFRSSIPGGFASATVSLDRPLLVQPDEIAYYGRLRIHDARHGGVVWEGRLEDPGRSVGSDGQIWDLAAIGPAGHAHDITAPLIYCYRDLTHWQRTAATKEAGRINQDEHTDGSPALLLGAMTGTWNTSDSIRTTSKWVTEAGQNLARVNWQMVGGSGSSNWLMQGYVWQATSTLIRSATLTSAVQSLSPRIVGTHWTHPQGRLELRLMSDAAGQAGGDTRWAKFWNVRIRATQFDTAGSEITDPGFYAADGVTDAEIVQDLLGRRLPLFDGPNALVETAGSALDQMAYPDGVSAAEVLGDLMTLYPAYYWAAWESNQADLYRFEWRGWPTEVRYEADVVDGYNSTGSADGLYNAVAVRWRDSGGTIRTTRQTSTVLALDNAGITREALVNLGDEVASSGAATTAANDFLADHAEPPNQGRLTVARPIRDIAEGRMVWPWEIRPGHLIRVRGVLPRPDALNADGRDGVTIFRVVSSSFSASAAAATLELDSFAPSTARALADLQERRTRRS